MAASPIDSYDFAGEVDLEALFLSLKRTGGIILKNIATKEDLAQLEKDVRPHIEADKAWTGSFFPAQTRCVLVPHAWLPSSSLTTFFFR